MVRAGPEGGDGTGIGENRVSLLSESVGGEGGRGLDKGGEGTMRAAREGWPDSKYSSHQQQVRQDLVK